MLETFEPRRPGVPLRQHRHGTADETCSAPHVDPSRDYEPASTDPEAQVLFQASNAAFRCDGCCRCGRRAVALWKKMLTSAPRWRVH